ncbi:MAG: hypothetical protein IPK52_18510 [Chloroflexi bacterium]|nr:hypothetical protein [Chloroflexota bacterium]
MRLSRLTFFIVSVLLLGLTSAAAAQAPRTVPPNDNLINAVDLVVGKSYSVSDIGAATNQSGEPAVSCGPNAIYNSVWYTLYPEIGFSLYLSTDGTQLFDTVYNDIDTVIAVFTGPGIGSLTEVACVDDQGSLFSEMFLDVTNTEIYKIAVGTYNDIDFLPNSVLKFNTRLTYLPMDVANRGFEDSFGPPWKMKNSTGDSRVCGDVNYPAQFGLCAFKFTGDPNGTTAKLSQAIPMPAAFQFRKNGVFSLSWHHRVLDVPALSGTKLVVTVNYTDGTPATKSIVSLGSVAAEPDYAFGQYFVYLASGKVASIKFDVKFKATDGVMLFDSFDLLYYAAAITRDSVLPAPAAPK